MSLCDEATLYAHPNCSLVCLLVLACVHIIPSFKCGLTLLSFNSTELLWNLSWLWFYRGYNSFLQ